MTTTEIAFDPSDEEFRRNPYPRYAELRERDDAAALEGRAVGADPPRRRPGGGARPAAVAAIPGTRPTGAVGGRARRRTRRRSR